MASVNLSFRLRRVPQGAEVSFVRPTYRACKRFGPRQKVTPSIPEERPGYETAPVSGRTDVQEFDFSYGPKPATFKKYNWPQDLKLGFTVKQPYTRTYGVPGAVVQLYSEKGYRTPAKLTNNYGAVSFSEDEISQLPPGWYKLYVYKRTEKVSTDLWLRDSFSIELPLKRYRGNVLGVCVEPAKDIEWGGKFRVWRIHQNGQVSVEKKEGRKVWFPEGW